ncbi:hypothetical protein, partial [Actinoplanes philippinensis]|uniref:hypothetical protein n=1 Tax=Actinoplanes philippinensis TaxID=35752 RepID=UPI0033CA4ECF
MSDQPPTARCINVECCELTCEDMTVAAFGYRETGSWGGCEAAVRSRALLDIHGIATMPSNHYESKTIPATHRGLKQKIAVTSAVVAAPHGVAECAQIRGSDRGLLLLGSRALMGKKSSTSNIRGRNDVSFISDIQVSASQSFDAFMRPDYDCVVGNVVTGAAWLGCDVASTAKRPGSGSRSKPWASRHIRRAG